MTLNPFDAMIIVAVLRATKVDTEKLLVLLQRASEPGQQVGRYLLGLNPDASPEIRELAGKIVEQANIGDVDQRRRFKSEQEVRHNPIRTSAEI